MKQYHLHCTPQHTSIDSIRLLTWNIANNFGNGEPIKRLFINHNYSYMALQEPTRKFNQESAKHLKAQIGQDQIILIPTPNQYILIK